MGPSPLPAAGAGAAQPGPVDLSAPAVSNVSLGNEVKHAIRKGLSWLEKNQDTNGFWSSPDYPAITALGLSAFKLQPGGLAPAAEPPAVKRGYAYLLSCVKPDGGIYKQELASYNTAIALTALVLANHPEFDPVIVKAREFVVSLQADLGERGKIDTVSDGGMGYGKADKQPDLSNTSWALEALALSRNYLKGENRAVTADLNWQAAINFIQNCQNLPKYNSQSWASDDPRNKGGFVYSPTASKAGETNLASGRIALRSYGSMSYAGLLSYIYADLKSDDPRVTAVMDWLQANYTLEENPALGQEGLYYYYHTMAKALTVYGAGTLVTRSGQKVNWREQLALKLINLQRADGSWANENGRWFEKDPALVTAYSLMALEMIYPRL